MKPRKNVRSLMLAAALVLLGSSQAGCSAPRQGDRDGVVKAVLAHMKAGEDRYARDHPAGEPRRCIAPDLKPTGNSAHRVAIAPSLLVNGQSFCSLPVGSSWTVVTIGLPDIVADTASTSVNYDCDSLCGGSESYALKRGSGGWVVTEAITVAVE